MNISWIQFEDGYIEVDLKHWQIRFSAKKSESSGKPP